MPILAFTAGTILALLPLTLHVRCCAVNPALAANVEFSGEEGYGRFVDMHSLYDRFINLKGIERVCFASLFSVRSATGCCALVLSSAWMRSGTY